MVELLKNVAQSLGTIKCDGYDNWNTLVGCINAVRTVADALDGALQANSEDTSIEEKKEVADG